MAKTSVGIRGTWTSIVLQELCLVVLGPYPDNDTDDIFRVRPAFY